MRKVKKIKQGRNCKISKAKWDCPKVKKILKKVLIISKIQDINCDITIFFLTHFIEEIGLQCLDRVPLLKVFTCISLKKLGIDTNVTTSR